MTMLARFSFVLLALAASACAQPPMEMESGPSGSPPPRNRVIGEYLVGVAPGADPAKAREVFAQYGIAEWRFLREGTYLVRLERDPGPERLKEASRTSPWIRYVEPNQIYRIQR